MHYLNETLFLAIRTKDPDSVKTLIRLVDASEEASFKAFNAQGNTLLHHAIQHKSWDAFELLFDHLNQILYFNPTKMALAFYLLPFQGLNTAMLRKFLNVLKKLPHLKPSFPLFF